MTLTRSGPRGITITRALLRSLIEMPDLPGVIQELPAQTFAALIREVGVEDAGELVALATTEQIVQAFDEELFVSDRAGDRETLDAGRFVVWLEVLLEAGDDVAARRFSELDEDFVAHALSSIVLVLDDDSLRLRLDAADEEDIRQVDKALESALTEDLDGYLLVAKQHDGMDAVLALILALDRDHRALLVRLLDRLAAAASSYLDDLDELSTVLTAAESLAEDVEAAREERRHRQGHVEARAARGFLELARKPLDRGGRPMARDPLTRAYFRDLGRNKPLQAAPNRLSNREALRALPENVRRALRQTDEIDSGLALRHPSTTAMRRLTRALQELDETTPATFGERMEELAYLANVLVMGHERDGQRMTPREAAEAVLATVAFGAFHEAGASGASETRAAMRRRTPTLSELVEILRIRSADVLFRVASSVLSSGAAPRDPRATKRGLVYSSEDLEAALRDQSSS